MTDTKWLKSLRHSSCIELHACCMLTNYSFRNTGDIGTLRLLLPVSTRKLLVQVQLHLISVKQHAASAAAASSGCESTTDLRCQLATSDPGSISTDRRRRTKLAGNWQRAWPPPPPPASRSRHRPIPAAVPSRRAPARPGQSSGSTLSARGSSSTDRRRRTRPDHTR